MNIRQKVAHILPTIRALACAALLAVSFAILAATAVADEACEVYCGNYVGRGYVYNESGAAIKSEFRLSVRAGEDGYYTMEMLYLDDQVARFKRLRRLRDDALEIREGVGTGGEERAGATGTVVFRKDRGAAGTIVVKVQKKNGELVPLRTIKFLTEKLKVAGK